MSEKGTTGMNGKELDNLIIRIGGELECLMKAPGSYRPSDSTVKCETFGAWYVSEEGDMFFETDRYEIHSDQLTDKDWIAHLFAKAWIDWNDFIPAYFQALRNIGVKEQKILIYYK